MIEIMNKRCTPDKTNTLYYTYLTQSLCIKKEQKIFFLLEYIMIMIKVKPLSYELCIISETDFIIIHNTKNA